MPEIFGPAEGIGRELGFVILLRSDAETRPQRELPLKASPFLPILTY
jgi:hypothetical protein